MSRWREKRRGGWWRVLALAATSALLVAVGVAAVRADLIDRVVHPQRYAVSGEGLLPADAYVTAARGTLGRGGRIAALWFPDRLGPVVATIVGADGDGQTVYLDPPTARVLAVDEGGGREPDALPLADPGQPVGRVVQRARAVGTGAVRGVDWPTTRHPDWTVRFADAPARRVKVADDSGSARAVLAREQGGVLTRRGSGWLIVAGGVVAVVGMALWRRRSAAWTGARR